MKTKISETIKINCKRIEETSDLSDGSYYYDSSWDVSLKYKSKIPGPDGDHIFTLAIISNELPRALRMLADDIENINYIENLLIDPDALIS